MVNYLLTAMGVGVLMIRDMISSGFRQAFIVCATFGLDKSKECGTLKRLKKKSVKV